MPTIEESLIFIGKVLKSLSNIILKKLKDMSQPKI